MLIRNSNIFYLNLIFRRILLSRRTNYYMNRFKKTIYLLLLALFIVILGSNPTLAASLDLSHGVMPDNPLYQVDLNLEKIELYTHGSDEQQARLHLQYGTERLNEMDYLANNQKLHIDNVVDLSNDYQQNINEFKKIAAKNENISQNINELAPQIEELQVIQSQVVAIINEQPTQMEVKIIVKSTIKESQTELIEAVENVKKPIVDKAADVNNTNPDTAQINAVKQIDETIVNLNKQKDQLKEEIKIDENNLKQAKKDSKDSSDSNNINIITTTDPATIVNNTDTQSEAIDSIAVIDMTDNFNPTNDGDDTILSNPENNINTEANAILEEWYYSPSCDYVSLTNGKDPICGEDMIAVSSLPADNSFFTKYTYKDGKYVQNVDDMIAKAEEVEKEPVTPDLEVIVEPLVTSETIPVQ